MRPLVLFLGVFGLAGVAPTGAGLFFLRPYRSFWRAVSVAAITIASTGIAALVVYVVPQIVEAGPTLQAWSAVAVLRILVAPLFGLAFFLCAVFAPDRSSRGASLTATAVDAVIFAYVALVWFHPFGSR